MSTNFKIGKIVIGENTPLLIIAEIGINHNGSLDLAIAIADRAIKAGVEIIKHQTHVIDDEMTDINYNNIYGCQFHPEKSGP